MFHLFIHIWVSVLPQKKTFRTSSKEPSPEKKTFSLCTINDDNKGEQEKAVKNDEQETRRGNADQW